MSNQEAQIYGDMMGSIQVQTLKVPLDRVRILIENLEFQLSVMKVMGRCDDGFLVSAFERLIDGSLEPGRSSRKQDLTQDVLIEWVETQVESLKDFLKFRESCERSYIRCRDIILGKPPMDDREG